MEEKRINNKIRFIKGIFAKNPLDFDELNIDQVMSRKQKEKERMPLFKTFEQIQHEANT